MKPAPSPAPTSVPLSAEALFDLAIEIWRLERRFRRATDDPARVRASVDRMAAALARCGLELRDPEGERYRPGQLLDIIGSEGGGAVVAETVRPAVYFQGQMQVMAQVILGPEKSGEDENDN